MNEQIRTEYFRWLYTQVGDINATNHNRTYSQLTAQLHEKEFVWFVPNDDNRVSDGKQLRYEFLDEFNIQIADREWLDGGCSMFEMLIALARRLAFQTDGEPDIWFWHLIETMDLKKFNDQNYDDYAEQKIDETCNRVIWRQYGPDGRGGLFPLNRPPSDQTKAEIWYQAAAYLSEVF